jgi:hypothetical protein
MNCQPLITYQGRCKPLQAAQRLRVLMGELGNSLLTSPAANPRSVSCPEREQPAALGLKAHTGIPAVKGEIGTRKDRRAWNRGKANRRYICSAMRLRGHHLMVSSFWRR